MKVKVGVFFGGRSVEHEVSIISAIQAINNMDSQKYDIIPIYITRKDEFYVGEDIGDIEQYKDIKNLLEKSQRVVLINTNNKVELVKYPFKKFGNNVYDYIDIAFPIVHGTNVEDGALQGYFKTLNIPFVGCDVLSSAIGMDKYVMKTVLKDNNIPVLDCLVFNNKQYNKEPEKVLEKIEEKFSYPVIVKPINLGSSVGIKIGNDRGGLEEALEYAFQYSKKLLVEPAIVNLREINCSVLGDYEDAIPSECEEPFHTDEILSYEDKYISNAKSSGSKGMESLSRKLPAEIPVDMKEKIQRVSSRNF